MEGIDKNSTMPLTFKTNLLGSGTRDYLQIAVVFLNGERKIQARLFENL
jgi:hypothetical protein